MKNTFILLLLAISMTVATAQRNVILIIADDLGSDWCGFQENHLDTVNMPNVRKLLSRGVRFSNAWVIEPQGLAGCPTRHFRAVPAPDQQRRQS